MQRNDHWSWRGWYVFALVAGLSLLTKYVIRYRGSHIFNPSNVGLVAAFLLLGSTRVEPLDFWWGPFDGWMIAAYLIILVGGLLITARLHLLGMSAAFWLTLAVGIGILAASGHCMTARWSFEPVCGARFWWVIVFSPEILIFLFFMITDPRTTPGGRVARVVFGIGVAWVCTLLIAPQTTEFGTKVAVLAALALICAARPVAEVVSARIRAPGSGGPSRVSGSRRITSPPVSDPEMIDDAARPGKSAHGTLAPVQPDEAAPERASAPPSRCGRRRTARARACRACRSSRRSPGT